MEVVGRAKRRLENAVSVIGVQNKRAALMAYTLGVHARQERREDRMAAAHQRTPAPGSGAAC